MTLEDAALVMLSMTMFIAKSAPDPKSLIEKLDAVWMETVVEVTKAAVR